MQGGYEHIILPVTLRFPGLSTHWHCKVSCEILLGLQDSRKRLFSQYFSKRGILPRIGILQTCCLCQLSFLMLSDLSPILKCIIEEPPESSSGEQGWKTKRLLFFSPELEGIEANREQQVQNSTVSRRNSIWAPDYITPKAVLLTMFLDHFLLRRLRCNLCSGSPRLSIHSTPVLYNQQVVDPKISELPSSPGPAKLFSLFPAPPSLIIYESLIYLHWYHLPWISRYGHSIHVD